MNKQIDRIKNFRQYLLKQIEGLTVEQLNEIPEGYHNNIVWNLGHLVSVEQNICYVRSGLPIAIANEFFAPYFPGTKPERFIGEEETNMIKELLISSTTKLQSDYEQQMFGKGPYTPSEFIPKVYGIHVTNIDEAIDYLIYHEGTHAGYILALKRVIR